MWVVGDDWRGGGFNEVGEMRVWELLSKGVNGGCREDDIADLSQSNEENLQSGFNRRFVNQHHWDVVLDGIDAAAGVALETGAAVDQRDGRLAVRARENFEQFRVNRHGWDYMTSPLFVEQFHPYEVCRFRRHAGRVGALPRNCAGSTGGSAATAGASDGRR